MREGGRAAVDSYPSLVRSRMKSGRVVSTHFRQKYEFSGRHMKVQARLEDHLCALQYQLESK